MHFVRRVDGYDRELADRVFNPGRFRTSPEDFVLVDMVLCDDVLSMHDTEERGGEL